MPDKTIPEDLQGIPMITPARNSALKRMYETGEWSDLTIETATKTFKVHKSVVCPACPFFHAACTNGFKESQTGVIQLEESEVVVDAILRFIYEQPIDWLIYHPLSLAHPITELGDENTVHHGSMALSYDFWLSEDSRKSAEESRTHILRLLELDCAVDKYGLRALGRIMEASFGDHFVPMKNIVDMVELGSIVYGSDRHTNKVLRKYVRGRLGVLFDKILKSPEAWDIIYSNEEMLMDTVKDSRVTAEEEKRREVRNASSHAKAKADRELHKRLLRSGSGAPRG